MPNSFSVHSAKTKSHKRDTAITTTAHPDFISKIIVQLERAERTTTVFVGEDVSGSFS